MLAGRRDDRPPAAGRARLRERDLGDAVVAIELARLLVGADDVEREVLEHPDADAVAVRASAVRAAADAVVDRLGGPGEAVAVERAIDDRRDPPAGDRVLAQLEQARRPSAGQASTASGASMASRERRGEDPGGAPRPTPVDGGCVAVAALARDRRRGDAGHPARVDEVEVGEVDGHVEGDAVVA